MACEYVGCDDEVDFVDAVQDVLGYLAWVEQELRGVRKGRVPCSHFWLVDGSLVVGTSRVRHSLTQELEREIGHIGYDIRPSQRRRGYGATLLRLTLTAARDLGLSKVWLVCDAHNFASVSMIEKSGASFEGEITSTRTGDPIRRYLIAL